MALKIKVRRLFVHEITVDLTDYSSIEFPTAQDALDYEDTEIDEVDVFEALGQGLESGQVKLLASYADLIHTEASAVAVPSENENSDDDEDEEVDGSSV